MKFKERKNPPKKLQLPGWKDEIAYETLRDSFPEPVFVLAFGSAIKPPQEEIVTTRFLLWDRQKRTKRYAGDVDLLVVTEKSIDPYHLRNGMPYWTIVGDSYDFAWVVDEYPGALHLQVTTLQLLEQAIAEKDSDALRILNSCEVIEGDVSLVKSLIYKSNAA